MRKKSFVDKSEKMIIEASNINKKNNNVKEKGNSIKIIANKSKSLNRKVKTREEIKQLEIDILDYVVEICDKNNIKYFLSYGTL